jgi:hypothetical protein
MKTSKFDVFGHDVAIAKTESGWQAFYSGVKENAAPPEIS